MSDSGYVFVCEDENVKEEGVELPVEEDGSMLLSVLQSQFNGCSGLKYRNPVTGTWRAVKLVEGCLRAPDKGWGDAVYVVVKPPPSKAAGGSNDHADGVGVGGGESAELEERSEGKQLEELPCEEFSSMGYSSDGYKRKLEDSEGQRASKNPRSHSPDNYPNKPASPAVSHSPSSSPYRNQEDLIILGLEWSVTDQELRNYFAQFGELSHCEVKKDIRTGKSRGFGFVRYGNRAIQADVFKSAHTIKGRKVELKYPKQSIVQMPNKLFVGCLPLKPEVENAELTEYFSQYGRLNDVYIPRPYRGFGFVTFTDPGVAQKVVNMRHTIRKSSLNVSFADPKGSAPKPPPSFSADPFAVQFNYPAHVSRVQATAAPRYPFSGQPQQQQAYALGYGAAIPRADPAMGTVHAVPVSNSPGLMAVSYSNAPPQPQVQQHQQQSPYDRPAAGSYR